MEDGLADSEKTTGKLVRRRKRKLHERIPGWILEYTVELGIGVAVLAAIFLLVEPWNIRKSMMAFINRFIKMVTISLNGVIENLKKLTLSDTIALFILFCVIFAIFLRIRWRILRNSRLWNDHCPRCDSGGLMRVRRQWFDRLIGISGIPVRRYRCEECKWRGLRIYKPHGRQYLKK